ncbi:MAG: LacI family DNA-binding transcriptional regulator [Anaerolineae bacterium]|jgi:LacI family transcriptional regulator|uniref:LacI family DNA-binding transcriptional regulator n=1 Tax=Candidatus Flexifilum breve TaxID=3140694 RepID=UPI001AC51051|nr:LacI family DNA-binding transcriptional regulator [Chloroflexota bacterium]MBK9746338.1 LacI family DNA-binding transcriptional regulator [Chloroflexota bacterium]MBN8635416.1 LacI family DNA-binding transcriptional regulator [Anaerolineae bacterium]
MKKRPTLREVAQLAGVSKATAARVVSGSSDPIREETRQRVYEAVERLGYERHAIAGSLRSARTYMIALSIPDITNPFWPEVARGIQDKLEEAGYTVVLLNNDWNVEREQTHLRRMGQKQFDGLIINPTGTLNSDLIKLRLPVVALAAGDSFPDFDTVSSDSAAAGRRALEHLLELGHRRIGIIAGQLRRRKSHTHLNTYTRLMEAHGLTVDPQLMIETDFSQESGYQALKQILAQPQPPTAVFAVNDILALGALQAAQAAQLAVPEQLSIIGMDDIFAAATAFPPLTTIAKPKYDIGLVAAQYLLERMNGTPISAPRHTLLPCTLVLRSSTAPPN